jgi:hypothetical protein
VSSDWQATIITTAITHNIIFFIDDIY